MDKSRLIIFFLIISLFSNRILAQSTENNNQYQLYENVTICDSNIFRAMDSCILVLSKCHFYKEGIESEVWVRPISTSLDFVTSMYFSIRIKDINNIRDMVEQYSIMGIDPKHCYYKGLSFVFFFPDKTGKQLKKNGVYDTIFYNGSQKLYKYTSVSDIELYKKCRAKCDDIIEGIVYLRQDDNEEWHLKVVDCIQVDNCPILFEDEKTRMYFIKP